LALSGTLALGSGLLAAPPSFQTLGDFGEAIGLSADGSVVVGRRVIGIDPCDPGGIVPHYLYEPVRWENGVTTGLGDLPGGATDGAAYAASADGSVIVGYGGGESGREPFRWENGAMTSLGTSVELPPGGACIDVSAEGSVVVGITDADGGFWPSTEAFRWENGVMTVLGVTATHDVGWASSVSADGSVVVGSRASLSGGGADSFRWESGVMTSIGLMGANRVSADGSTVVGGAGLSTGPWRWHDGVWTELGGLPGRERGRGLDVSADGSAVVGAVGGEMGTIWDETTLGFLWTPEGGTRSVSDVLVDDYGLDLDGWMLNVVAAVSDDATTIVGNATMDVGDRQIRTAWIAHIPEPATLALLAVGALAWIGRGRSGATRVST